MQFKHRNESETDIIDLGEVVDLYAVPEIKKFCRTLIHSGSKKLILTMNRVVIIDSSGIGMIYNIYYECQQEDVEFRVAELSEEVKRIFTISKVGDSFPISSSLEEAIESLNKKK